MTTKKVLIVAGAVVACLVLLAALIVGAVAGAVYYAVGNSKAADAAREFLRRNERLTSDIGEVREFGSFVTGRLNAAGPDGNATLNLKVVGARRSVNASVDLYYRGGDEWHVTGATYKNEAGQTIELLDRYELEEPEEAARPVTLEEKPDIEIHHTH